jgi:succinoglycan biosynthesis protein ExoU
MNAAAHSVCVVIAAWNAENTVVRAVASALAQPEVSEVVVVDDASTDDTVAAALGGCDGSGRLRVIEQPENRGPSAARNRAIAESNASFLAVLDSDDFFVPGRFAMLLDHDDWDAIFDNLAFIPENRITHFAAEDLQHFAPNPELLTFAAFVEGNISRRGMERAELGFIKPLMRRSFLQTHALHYDETLRLGEDYALYSRMLAAGATFKQIKTCGYVAVERDSSLSGRHQTEDLAALLASDDVLCRLPHLGRPEREAVQRHRAKLAANLRHRRFLDIKRADGLVTALRNGIETPANLPELALAVMRDKFATFRARYMPSSTSPEVRYLFS